METIDLMTAMLLGLSINVIMAVIILITAKDFPKIAADSMKFWAIGLFFLALSYLIFSGIYQNTTRLFNLLADFSTVLAVTFMSYAVSIFLKVNRTKIYQLIVIFALTALLVSGVILNNPNITIIFTLISVSLSILVLAKPLIHNILHHPTPAKVIIFSINALFIIILAYRAIDYFLMPLTVWDFNNNYFADFLTIMISVIGPVTSTFGFMLMHQERAYMELARLASVDCLTQIYNRHAIELKARKLFKQSNLNQKPISVMLIDLDKFKSVNDQFGHAEGDDVLYNSAQIIKDVIGENNMVGRFGGEEFFVILPDYNLEQAAKKSQQLLTAFRQHNHGQDINPYQITASIGVVEKKPEETSFSTTLKRADSAMYEAKNSGRDQAILG